MKEGLKKMRLLLCLTLAGLLLYGCSMDEDTIKSDGQEKMNVSHKSFNELLKDTKFNTSYEKVLAKKSQAGKTVMEDMYQFTIVDREANVIENENETTYTLLIKRDIDVPNTLENLIIKNDSLNQTTAYIIKYTSTTEITPDNFNVTDVNLTKQFTPIVYNANSSNTSKVVAYVCLEVPVWVCNYSGHTPTGVCTQGYWDSMTFCYQDVGGGNDAPGGGDPLDPTGTGGGTGTGTGGTVTPPPNNCGACNPQIPTAPVFEVGDDDEESNTPYLSQNVLALQNHLLNNPFALIKVPCAQLPFWQAIAQHQAPQSVKDKISAIDAQTGWFASAGIQTLNDSNNGTVVNMDFFPVTISQMPKKPNGQTYTQKELFDYIRTHINDFFDDLTFTPAVHSSYNINDTALWLSNNPLGAILEIDIEGNEGSVVCSNYNSSTGEWIFSTITDPWLDQHPVSGNRAFGYYTDINGKMVIYTRGVDRITHGTYMYGQTGVAAEAAQQVIGFAKADSKWSSFQNKIKNFVNAGQTPNNNGVSTVNIPIKYRPNWNKVKDVLAGIRPISDLGCD